MNILIINCGSSSLKFQINNPKEENALIEGIIEEIGQKHSFIKFEYNKNKQKINQFFKTHKEALNFLLELLIKEKIIESLEEIQAIGHRVVHGGEIYPKSTIIDGKVKQDIKNLSILAPLHNPANLIGIEVCEELIKNKPQVAVFDTAFHQTMPQKSFIYSIPYEYYQKDKIRKYGFHGTSHFYISNKFAQITNQDLNSLNLITCHLGNGASICAIEQGKSIDTTMGFTPLEGLTMGTRSGDIDPSIITYLMEKENLTSNQISDLLNKKSGLLGISQVSSDCREVENAANQGNKLAKLALDRVVYVARKNLCSYFGVLQKVDGIIFSAGLGENGIKLREDICKNLEHIGVKIDTNLNKTRGKEQIISTPDSKIKVYVIPTNEELVIAQETYNLVKNK